MQTIVRIYLNLFAIALCAVSAVATFYLVTMVGLLLVADHLPTWSAQLIGVVAAIIVSSWLARRLLLPRFATTRPSRSLPYKLASGIAYGLLGALLLGGTMQFGTLLLGHMRPTWMEFGHVPTAALCGVVLGALYGLALAARPSSAQP